MTDQAWIVHRCWKVDGGGNLVAEGWMVFTWMIHKIWQPDKVRNNMFTREKTTNQNQFLNIVHSVTGIVWFRWRGWDYTLKKASMMIRPRGSVPNSWSTSYPPDGYRKPKLSCESNNEFSGWIDCRRQQAFDVRRRNFQRTNFRTWNRTEDSEFRNWKKNFS